MQVLCSCPVWSKLISKRQENHLLCCTYLMRALVAQNQVPSGAGTGVGTGVGTGTGTGGAVPTAQAGRKKSGFLSFYH